MECPFKELSESISSQKETAQFLQQQKVQYSNTEKCQRNEIESTSSKKETKNGGVRENQENVHWECDTGPCIISSDEESNRNAPVMPMLQRSTAVRNMTKTQSETNLDSLAENEDPGVNPPVISGDKDADILLSCVTGESAIVDNDATTVGNKEQSFLGL